MISSLDIGPAAFSVTPMDSTSATVIPQTPELAAIDGSVLVAGYVKQRPLVLSQAAIARCNEETEKPDGSVGELMRLKGDLRFMHQTIGILNTRRDRSTIVLTRPNR